MSLSPCTKTLMGLLVPALLTGTPLRAESPQVLDEIQAYLDFATYAEGAISTRQLQEMGLGSIAFIDTRTAELYAADHIPDASHIEWREILSRRDEVPQDQPVVLYCDTGLLSSKAQFMLRLAGFENVKVLYGGYDAWKRHQNAH